MKFASIWDISYGSFLQVFLNIVVGYKKCGQFSEYFRARQPPNIEIQFYEN